jgi:eukaryotic-like serine/threonine-protein kinase
MQGETKRQAAAFSAGAPMPVPGDVVADKYRIEAVLGRGGMSVVYRATHIALEQQVAIKVLSSEALLLPEYVVRLKREARAVSRIRSEHVVRVHDIGELAGSGVPYLVMECLDGLDLAAVLARRGPFPVPLAIECIMQACEALAEAHALGIIHRDLKPANLFLGEGVDGSPCVKVLDFGISRMSQRHGLSALTDPGMVLGTPSYMAPEQMEGSDALDARSDIWALGTILYELLVGKPPYTGDSLPQIFVKIMRSRRPKPSALRAGVRSGVDDIIAQCLELDPADRFQTVAELAWALSSLGAPRARDSAARISRVLERQSTEPPPPGSLRSNLPTPVAHAVRRWSRRLRRAMPHVGAALASVALLGVASVFGVLALRDAPDPEEVERTVTEPAPRPPAGPAGGAVALAVLPAVGAPRVVVDGGNGQTDRSEKVRGPATPVRE